GEGLQPQDVSAPSCRPDEFETVSHYKHNQEGVPDRAEPLELHHRCDQGNDRQNTPAQASDDAVGFAASSKVGEAVGAVDAEVQAAEVQASATNGTAYEVDSNRQWNRIAASEDSGREARVGVQRPLPRVSWGRWRRRTRSADTGPLLDPRADGALRHDFENSRGQRASGRAGAAGPRGLGAW